ncbi:MAG: diguanylate cyclase [Lachnospiraceae bacterium]|nr:diguanylate cyclase [Lachnospiraceae bacterium]
MPDYLVYILMAGLGVIVIALFVVCLVMWRKYAKLRESFRSDRTELETLRKSNDEFMGQKSILEGRIDELTKQNERFSKSAYVDSLTELPNRNAFEDMVEGSVSLRSENEKIAVMMLSITNYAELIDEAGYFGMEQILIDLSHRLLDALDPEDYLSRFSGDRFAVISQHVEEGSAYEEKLARILDTVSQSFFAATRECFVYMSAGITFAPDDGTQFQSLIKNAQMALDGARLEGRNNAKYFTPELLEAVALRISLQAEMKRAVDEEKFTIKYKKQLVNKKPTGRYLAAPYWIHEEKGVLEPKHFMDAASDDRTAVHIGTFVFEKVCRDIEERAEGWPEKKVVLILVSEREIFDSDYYDFVKKSVEKHGTCAGKIEFILDGRIILRNPDRI